MDILAGLFHLSVSVPQCLYKEEVLVRMCYILYKTLALLLNFKDINSSVNFRNGQIYPREERLEKNTTKNPHIFFIRSNKLETQGVTDNFGVLSIILHDP
ncbi:hypothetical protein ACJX0J_040796, partial [Zea mays]